MIERKGWLRRYGELIRGKAFDSTLTKRETEEEPFPYVPALLDTGANDTFIDMG